jgi:hypothetical protein
MPGPILGQPNYAAIADALVRLPSLVAAKRAGMKLDVKTAAEQAGLTATTFAKFETGVTAAPTQTTILAAIRWLAAS